MSRALRYAVLIPLSVLAFYALFVMPDIDLGWPGGLAMLAAAWLVVMEVLRKRWRDTAESDERDRQIEARASGWARGGLSILVLALAVVFAFSPLDHLAWAKPMTISNLLMIGLIASCLLEYAVTGVTYWRDRRGA